MTTPSLTVVLPAFGPERVVARAVSSIARQTEPGLEVVVVHDPADEAATKRRCSGLSGLPLVAFVATRNPLPGAIRNIGIAAGRGRYVAVVDGAESVNPSFFESARAALDQTPDRAFAAALGPLATGLPRPDTLDLPYVLASPWAVGSVVVLRRSVVDDAGRFDEALPELVDWELLLKLCETGGSGIVLPRGEGGRYDQDDVRLREALRADRHLPAVRRVFARHSKVFEQYAPQVLRDRESLARTLWQTHGLPLATHREAIRAELTAVDDELRQVRHELHAYGRDSLEWADLRRTTPVSRYWGLERGRPVDRHYIEGFLAEHAGDVRGAVLEVLDANLTATYGGDRVTRSDVLDIDAGNHRATVVADLRVGGQLPAETYDCFILTQTLHLLDDMYAAVAQVYGTLKPGGVVLATLPCLSMVAEEYGASGDYWRVTEAGARRLFESVFPPEAVETRARGNVLTAAAFLYGLACDELTRDELEADDPGYPIIVTVRAIKPTSPTPGESPELWAPRIRQPRISNGRSSLILLYHQVTTRRADLHGLAVDVDTFRRHLDHLASHWRPMSLSALSAAAVDGEPPEGAVALTFDDGYVDNLEYAAPALAEFGVPATFFLSGEALERRRRFWWDCLEYALLVSEQVPDVITLSIDGALQTYATGNLDERQTSHDRLYPIFKASLPAVRDDLLRQLRTLTSIGGDDSFGGRPMRADEIRNLRAFPLITLGAHGLHHVSLTALSADERQRELFEGRSAIERVTGQRVDLFAYPFGDLSPETVEMVSAADYRFAVTCEARALQPHEHQYRLPRLSPPHGGGIEFIEWIARFASARTESVSKNVRARP